MNRNKEAKLTEQADKATVDLKDLVASTQDLLRSTASYTGTEIEEARSRLKRQLDSVQESASEWNQAAIEKYRRASAATDEYVHERPWTFIGAAVVLGVVLSQMFGGSNDRR